MTSPFVLAGKDKKDKNPEEMNRLRDQLVGTFKEQMDIRLAEVVEMLFLSQFLTISQSLLLLKPSNRYPRDT